MGNKVSSRSGQDKMMRVRVGTTVIAEAPVAEIERVEGNVSPCAKTIYPRSHLIDIAD